MTSTNNMRIVVATAITFIVLALGVTQFYLAHRAHAEATTATTITPAIAQGFTFLNATTTTATSTNLTGGGGYFVIAGAKHVSLTFGRGDTKGTGNSGSTNFRIQVTNSLSPSESDWLYYNTLAQNLSTSTTPTTLGTINVPAGTSTVMTTMPNLGFYAMRCIAIETTDGEHTCKAFADF